MFNNILQQQDRANEAQAESTPLKALREAVRLATPSPIKYLFTPQKLLASKSHSKCLHSQLGNCWVIFSFRFCNRYRLQSSF